MSTFPFFFAIASINLTAYTLRLVRTRQLNQLFYTHMVAKDTYHEIFACCFEALGRFWSGQKKAPSILEFNGIFEAFQVQFEAAIAEKRLVLMNSKKNV